MKVRRGFVSNSSSTSFIFVFRGANIESLYAEMVKYAVYFDLYGSWGAEVEDGTRHCDVWYVIDSIKRIQNPRITTIDAAIINLDSEIKSIEESRAKHTTDDMNNWFLDSIWDVESERITLEKAKKYGFTTIVTIDFGDNHGDVCGGIVGDLMDYEGRNIYINKPDFMVWTKQNR